MFFDQVIYYVSFFLFCCRSFFVVIGYLFLFVMSAAFTFKAMGSLENHRNACCFYSLEGDRGVNFLNYRHPLSTDSIKNVQICKFANSKFFISYIILYKTIVQKSSSNYCNLLTFVKKNIIPVSTWLIWTKTQLHVQMDVFNLVQIISFLLFLSFISFEFLIMLSFEYFRRV